MTSFAADILVKFRPGDIGCMAPKGILLGSAEWMCDPAPNFGFADHGNARHVFDVLERGVMPPGQKWPPDWLQQYQQWMTSGFSA